MKSALRSLAIAATLAAFTNPVAQDLVSLDSVAGSSNPGEIHANTPLKFTFGTPSVPKL